MADKSESGSLEIEQFVHFYKMLTQRDEVWKVFQDYSGDGERLMLEELELFLREEQHEGEQSAQHAKELIERYEPSETGAGGDAIFMYNVMCACFVMDKLCSILKLQRHSIYVVTGICVSLSLL